MTKIVAEFEHIFGKLTATERKWLSDHIEPLRSALAPFAERARNFAPYPDRDSNAVAETYFTVGELRAALAAHSSGYKSDDA